MIAYIFLTHLSRTIMALLLNRATRISIALCLRILKAERWYESFAKLVALCDSPRSALETCSFVNTGLSALAQIGSTILDYFVVSATMV